MEQIFMGLLSVAALAIGYYIGYLVQRRRVDELDEQASEAKDELEFCKREAQTNLETEMAKTKSAEVRLESQNAEWQKARSKLVADLQDLRSKMQTAEDVWVGSSEEIAEREKSLQAAEGKIEAARAELGQSRQTVSALQKQVQQLEQEKDSLVNQVADSLRTTIVEKPDTTDLDKLFDSAGDSLNHILGVLVENQGQRSAVISDANGIVVAAAGDKEIKDGMAATSQLVDGLTRQLDGMVPFSQLDFFCLQDSDSNIITGRAFQCTGETLGLATYGDSKPDEYVLDRAMSNLKGVLD